MEKENFLCFIRCFISKIGGWEESAFDDHLSIEHVMALALWVKNFITTYKLKRSGVTIIAREREEGVSERDRERGKFFWQSNRWLKVGKYNASSGWHRRWRERGNGRERRWVWRQKTKVFTQHHTQKAHWGARRS
jgi:hypothetical protein